MAKKRYTQKAASMKHGYRSGLEEKISEELKDKNVSFEYETRKIEYIVPEKKSKYTPDFILPNGVIVETKGRFVSADMKKHLLVKQQHPELDIRFLFQNSKNKIRKGSKTTYADWCIKHGFLFADKTIPDDWLTM